MHCLCALNAGLISLIGVLTLLLKKTIKNNNKIMNKLIQEIADRCIEEIDEHINNTIHWQLNFDDEDTEGDDLYELELKIKQQILFSLIKRVTK
jgi:hypothetical protein